MIRLSVIIPAYNADSYLERCVQSLQAQDIPQEEYDIIIVNDGSTDKTLELIKRLANQFHNISYINQENAGVSLARNAGIDKANGKYLLFVDADDYVAPHFFKRVLERADREALEVFWLSYRLLKPDDTIQMDYLFPGNAGKILQGPQAYTVAVAAEVPDPDRSCGILYLKDLLTRNKLRYIPQIPILEDGEFMARVSCLAGNCSFDNFPAYVRTTRPGSAINSNIFFSARAVEGFLKAAVHLKKFQTLSFLSEPQKKFLNQPICKFCMLFVNASFGKDGIRGLVHMKRSLEMKELLFCDLEGCNEEYRREGKIFNFSPVFYAFYKRMRIKLNYFRRRTSGALR